MKYIVISMAAVFLSIFSGCLLAKVFLRKKEKEKSKSRLILLTSSFSVIIMLLIFLAYMNIYSKAGETAEKALSGDENVNVQTLEAGYFFDGKGEETAIIFYGGAKVEAEAYAPLMLKLAQNGYDCFLADMPFNFPLLGKNTADEFIKAYKYDSWYIAGHSQGGLMASSYAAQTEKKIDGIILLASYSLEKLDDNLRLCSIYGSLDGCLNLDEYEANKGNWPTDSTQEIIDGANHSGFADYGNQKGDNEGKISNEKQQNETVKTISCFIEKR